MAWLGFSLAFMAFFASHSLLVRPAVKTWLITRIGATCFTLLYSAMSFGVLIWLVIAARQAPFVPIWSWAPWQNYVPLVAMLPVCLILVFSIGRPNPFSFGGAHNERFNPQEPGIVRVTRHPLLLALAIWAIGHIVPNGDVAHVILFGVFACFALVGRRIIDRRKQREMGETWHSLSTAVRQTPLMPSLISVGALIKLVFGVTLYCALIAFHGVIFGVSPLP